KDPPFLRCTAMQQDSKGLVLTWAPADRRVTLSELALAWRQNPEVHLPEALETVWHLSRAMSALDHLPKARFIVSPAQLFLSRSAEGREQWSVLLLPVEGAGLRDFATASPDTIAWLSGDDFVRRGMFDHAYVLGAALYYCLIADLYPAHLSQNERLH